MEWLLSLKGLEVEERRMIGEMVWCLCSPI